MAKPGRKRNESEITLAPADERQPAVRIDVGKDGRQRRIDLAKQRQKRDAAASTRDQRHAEAPPIEVYSPIVARLEAKQQRDKEDRSRARALRVALRDPQVDGTGPTALTKGRHRKTSFEVMCEKQEITGAMFEAAQEIDRVYHAICGALICRGASSEPGGRAAATPIAERFAWAHAKRYKPWALVLSARRNSGGPPALEVVIDVVVDGRGLRQIETDRRWKHGYAKYLVRRALLEYAEMAGWVRGEVALFDTHHPAFAVRSAKNAA